MKRSSFLKSLLTLLASPKLIKEIQWEKDKLIDKIEFEVSYGAVQSFGGYYRERTIPIRTTQWQMVNVDGKKTLVEFYKTPNGEVRRRNIHPDGNITYTNPNV